MAIIQGNIRLEAVFAVLLAAMSILGIAHSATAATNSTNPTNALNATAKPLVQPSVSIPTSQQPVNINIYTGNNVRTTEKTNIVGLGIIIIGAVGIAGGVNYSRRTRKRNTRKAKGNIGMQ